VEDGNIITARGVTAAIDLGLYLCEKIAGIEVRKRYRNKWTIWHTMVIWSRSNIQI
jgi:transcriptional regulator GlxA family with amidase domain